MSPSLAEIHARLRAADLALAMAAGGSSELARVREAVGSLLVAVHELAGLYERGLLAAGAPRPEAPAKAAPTQASASLAGGAAEAPAVRRRKP